MQNMDLRILCFMVYVVFFWFLRFLRRIIRPYSRAAATKHGTASPMGECGSRFLSSPGLEPIPPPGSVSEKRVCMVAPGRLLLPANGVYLSPMRSGRAAPISDKRTHEPRATVPAVFTPLL